MYQSIPWQRGAREGYLEVDAWATNATGRDVHELDPDRTTSRVVTRGAEALVLVTDSANTYGSDAEMAARALELAAGQYGAQAFGSAAELAAAFDELGVDLARAPVDAFDNRSIDIVAAWFGPDGVWCFWCGGAILAHVRDGAFVTRTRPHLAGERMLAAGWNRRVSYLLDEAFLHERVFGAFDPSGAPGRAIEAGEQPWDVAPGDSVLALSQEAWRYLDDAKLTSALRGPSPAKEIVRLAREQGGDHHITAVVVRVRAGALHERA